MRRAGAFLAGCMLASSASAQDGWTGTRLPGDKPGNVVSTGQPPNMPVRTGPADGQETGRLMAECVVARNKSAARAFALAGADASSAPTWTALQTILPNCVNRPGRTVQVGEVKFKIPVLKGLVAEAMLARGPMQRLPALPVRTDYRTSWAETEPNDRTVDEMAVCLAERAPDQVADLIWSKPASTAEAAAFGTLKPLIGPCLVANATLRTNLFGIRLALAKAYLHRLQDPTVAAVAK